MPLEIENVTTRLTQEFFTKTSFVETICITFKSLFEMKLKMINRGILKHLQKLPSDEKSLRPVEDVHCGHPADPFID